MILNWGPLIFTSPSNLLIPFVLFIASKRRMAIPDVDISGDPMTFLTPAEQSMSHVENTPAVCCDSTEKVGKMTSEKSGEVTKSTMDVIQPMPVANRMSSASKNGHQKQVVPGGVGGFSTGAERSLVPIGPTTLLEQTLSRAGNISAVIRVDTDSTAVDNDNMEKVKIDASEEHEELAVSSLDATPMPVVNRTYSPSTDPCYQHAAQSGSGSETLADTGVTDRPGLYLAFPILSPTWPIRSTHISAIGFLVAAALVLIAMVYNIVQNASG